MSDVFTDYEGLDAILRGEQTTFSSKKSTPVFDDISTRDKKRQQHSSQQYKASNNNASGGARAMTRSVNAYHDQSPFGRGGRHQQGAGSSAKKK
jgi:hypothetical protein